MLQTFKGDWQNMKNKIIEIAKRYDADVVGFAPAERFSKDSAVFKILPETKTVIFPVGSHT